MSIAIPARTPVPASERPASANPQAEAAARPNDAAAASPEVRGFAVEMLGAQVTLPAQELPLPEPQAPEETAMESLPGMAQPVVLPLVFEAEQAQGEATVDAEDGKMEDGLQPAVLAAMSPLLPEMAPTLRPRFAQADAAPAGAAALAVGDAPDTHGVPARASAQATHVMLAAVKDGAVEIPAAPRESVATAAARGVAAPLAGELASIATAQAPEAPQAAVKLQPAAPVQWRQPLLDALGERIRTQVGSRGENAVIRLEPAMLGRIDISIRHEGGMLQVQMSASHGEVVRQLNNISESLRQDLSNRQYADVSVTVSGGQQEGRRQQRQDQAEARAPGRALDDAGQGQAAFTL